MVDPSGPTAVHDIHTDQLGRPQKLTSQSGALAWNGAYDPFANPISISGVVTMLLGFPGQYWDSETELAQNWHRDYDPTIGRYLESDSMGLRAGVNSYSYVLANPLRWIDQFGLVSLNLLSPSIDPDAYNGANNYNPDGIYSVAGHCGPYTIEDELTGQGLNGWRISIWTFRITTKDYIGTSLQQKMGVRWK